MQLSSRAARRPRDGIRGCNETTIHERIELFKSVVRHAPFLIRENISRGFLFRIKRLFEVISFIVNLRSSMSKKFSFDVVAFAKGRFHTDGNVSK